MKPSVAGTSGQGEIRIIRNNSNNATLEAA
jgi:hypothetical protein